jgi:hypothetical protein
LFFLLFFSFALQLQAAGWKYPNIISLEATANTVVVEWNNGGKFNPKATGDITYDIYRAEDASLLTQNVNALLSAYSPLNASPVPESAEANTTSYIDEAVVSGLVYYYVIVAHDTTCYFMPYVKSRGQLNSVLVQ